MIGAWGLASGTLDKPKWARGLEDRSGAGWPKDRRQPWGSDPMTEVSGNTIMCIWAPRPSFGTLIPERM
jgi:hypothetical protein